MALLDELGLAETDYTHLGSKIDCMVAHFGDGFEAAVMMAQLGGTRNYLYGIDRNLFDMALWNRAASSAGITARAGFAVTQMLKDDAGQVKNASLPIYMLGQMDASALPRGNLEPGLSNRGMNTLVPYIWLNGKACYPTLQNM
jgi:hypothetical protein